MQEKLKKLLNGNLDRYKSVPFWSWNNSLDEGELVKQIEDMKSAGIGGFIMHARTGLKDKYLGEKWFSCIDACLKKARELNMNAWVYDENGWPSGFVGGKLLECERFRARFLEYSEGDFDKDAYVTYIENDNGFVRVDSPVENVKKYHNVYLRVSPANTDILEEEVVDAFIAETHEKYYERFKESFGRELVGFFTDEPQYYRPRTPFSHAAERVFASRGEDIKDGLIWLFRDDVRGYSFKHKYYQTMNDLYVNVFYKKLYDWCEAHNCKLTGHSLEENGVAGQMVGAAAVAPSYEYEHIPGIDWLGRKWQDESGPKQVGSASSQIGTDLVLTETFGCAGYDVTPYELKCIGEHQYFCGVNLMCQHLYPYTLAGRGKIDHPPVFSPHGNWFEHFKTFNDYFTKLGALIDNTEETCEVAVIHPVRSVWLNFIRSNNESVARAQTMFYDLLDQLRRMGLTYQFVDEKLLAKYGSTENGKLRVGKKVYDKVLIPDMLTITKTSYDLFKTYTGKLCLQGELSYIDGVKTNVDLKSNATIEEYSKNASVKFKSDNGMCLVSTRSGEVGDFIFARNLFFDKDETVHFENIAENYSLLNLENLTTSPISNDITLRRGEGIILIKENNPSKLLTKKSEMSVKEKFKVTDISENYFVMDYARIAKAGGEFSERLPIPCLFEELLREDYRGEVTVSQTFKIADKIQMKFMMERADLTSVSVNGKNISFKNSDFDVNFIEAEIGDCLILGDNEIRYSFNYYQHDGVHFALFDPLSTESLVNCLYFDTSIEPSYLCGNFVVDDDFVIRKREVLPALSSELYRAGYPFFKGELSVEGEVDIPTAQKVIIEPLGRYLVADIYVNGKHRELTLDTRLDITDLTKAGKNDVKIVLKSSLRNMFGPHHFKPIPEPLGVAPHHFDFRKKWTQEGIPETYTHDYNFVPFGLDDIIIELY